MESVYTEHSGSIHVSRQGWEQVHNEETALRTGFARERCRPAAWV